MANKTNKKTSFSLRRLIYNDKYLIIISLILAVVIWIVASINIGTDETKTIKMNVPITLGDEISEQYGMQYYSIQENIELNVTISGPKYVIGQVTDNDLTVNFDTSSVNRTGAQTIPILVTNNSRTLDFEITNTYPSTLEAFFDVNATKVFNVGVNYDESNIEKGYVFGKPILSEESVLVSGPQTYLEKIEDIYVDVDFEGSEKLTQPYNTECPLQVKGLGVESGYLKISNKNNAENAVSNVSVTIPVLKKTVLPVVADFEGEPFDVGKNVNIRYSVNKLNAGVLDGTNITQAVVGKINYNQLKVGENVFDFDVSNLQGITVLDDVKTIYAYVSVNKSYQQQTVDVSNVDIKVNGLSDSEKAKKVSFSNKNITVIAPKGTTITSNDISISVDVSSKNDNNLYQAQINVISNNKSWVFGKYDVKVEIE